MAKRRKKALPKKATKKARSRSKTKVLKAKSKGKKKATAKSYRSKSFNFTAGLPNVNHVIAKLQKEVKGGLRKNPFFAWLIPAIVLVFGIGLLISVTKSNRYTVTTKSAKLVYLFDQAKKEKFSERINFWSRKLRQNPRLLRTLGRGPKINDKAPLFPKKYDCTTYVETVAALARTEELKDLGREIVDIRYRHGNVSYKNRNHFPSLDWIPNNQRSGNLSDITATVAKKAKITPSYQGKTIYKTAWYHAQQRKGSYRTLASKKSSRGQDVKVAYVPLKKITKVIKHIPQGAVLNIVRRDAKSKPVLVTHQGFLIWKGKTPYFRHVTRQTRRIVDVPFREYVKKMHKYKWKVVGFNINQFKG